MEVAGFFEALLPARPPARLPACLPTYKISVMSQKIAIRENK
jgi:hypothetical protein